MARIVKFSKTGPITVSIGAETKYVCACGLSSTQPFCDGSHELAALEDAGRLYWYDVDGNCHELPDNFHRIRGE